MAVIVFDGDDTLWHVEYKYSQAYADFLAYLYKTVGSFMPNFHQVYRDLFDNEDRNRKEWGIRRGRVAESMLETYRKICQWIKEEKGLGIWREEHEAEIRKIGDQPFNAHEHHWMPNAQEVLAALQLQGHTLCLLTKYDSEVWKEKARVLGVARFFASHCISVIQNIKQYQDFASLAACATAGDKFITVQCITVGNDKKDMIPVEMDECWRGFYIPLPSTSPTEVKVVGANFQVEPYVHPRVVTLRNIRKVLSHI